MLSCFLLLIHPQASAGELINITGVASLKPVITVRLPEEQLKNMSGKIQDKAADIFGLYMVIDEKPAGVPVGVRYALHNDILSLTPVYALGNNLEFEVQYKTGDNNTSRRRFKTPVNPISSTAAKVVTAYPAADTIPYNTLFFHLRFSSAMMPDMQAYKHVKVFDEAGLERTNAWRQRSYWLDSNRLLVLMIHPGRVKRGIHYESPLFDSGKYYILEAGENMQDINGSPVATKYTKRFFVGGEDRLCPKAAINNNKLPSVNTSEPVLLSFSEGMDYVSVLDGAKIYDADGLEIPCSVDMDGADNTYKILPHRPWEKRKYVLVLKSAVCDLAANRINRPFEVKDIKEMEKDRLNTRFIFEIKTRRL